MNPCSSCGLDARTCTCACTNTARPFVVRLPISDPRACPSCGGDVRRCTCARAITALPTGASLNGTETATLARWCANTPAPRATNRAQRRAQAKR